MNDVSGKIEDRSPRTGGPRALAFALALVAFATQAPAHWDRTTLVTNVPTADVLPTGSLAVSANLSTRNWIDTPEQYDGLEAGAAVRFAPVDRLEVALTAYTLKDYALGASYRLLGTPNGAGFAVGVHDVGLNNYVSPIGHGLVDAWPDWKYDLERGNIRPMENISAFAVGSFPVAGFARLNLGLGRGRFVGYDRGRYLNTDMFFTEPHQWAFGLFGGVEVNLGRYVTLGAEFDGRDVNAALKLGFGPVSAAVALTKLEGLALTNPETRFGRFDAMVSYQVDNLYRRPASKGKGVKPYEQSPEPEPGPKPETMAVQGVKFELLPIYFGIDSSSIRQAETEILRRNATAIAARAQAGLKADVIIEGHCCPLASSEYNEGLGMRRAEAAKKYLVSLGVDAALLSTISYGELTPAYVNDMQYYLDRRAEFKWRQ